MDKIKDKRISYRLRQFYPYTIDVVEADEHAYNWCLEKAGTFALPFESSQLAYIFYFKTPEHALLFKLRWL